MLHKWNEIKLEDVRAINLRVGLAKFHHWQDNIAEWQTEKRNELARYEQMMTDIERDWNLYGNDTQELYDATSLCYLLLGGKMTGIDRNDEIARLTKVYYRVED
jgi:hypothetical protein